MKFVDEMNKDANKCCICCDLTTFMHVGDVLIIDFNKKDKPISLIELKEGRINEKLQEVLIQYHQTQCPRNIYLNIRNLEKNERDQIERIIRQQLRIEQAISAINEGEGIDISTGQKLSIPDEEFIIESYEEIIIEMYKEISNEKKWSIRHIDGCLFLGLYNDLRLAEMAFPTWMKEIGVDSPVWNYQNVFNIPLARPPFTLMLPADLIKALVTGKIAMRMCLHIPFWINNINGKYEEVRLELESTKKSRRLDFKTIDFIRYNNQYVKYKTKQSFGYVGSGILSKILFDFYRPIDSMRPMLTFPK
jgi:hypothetical protein